MLIAVDGMSGPAIVAAARALHLERAHDGLGGISPWDASGIFQEMRAVEVDEPALWPRTLLLLYAADLAFRLRWQIRPALNEGRTIVAAPYVGTAIALGRALSIPHRWLVELFRFAPQPDVRICAGAASLANGGKRLRTADGYVEFCIRELSQAELAGCEPTQIVTRLTRHFAKKRRAES
jgi:hypothetical protein